MWALLQLHRSRCSEACSRAQKTKVNALSTITEKYKHHLLSRKSSLLVTLLNPSYSHAMGQSLECCRARATSTFLHTPITCIRTNRTIRPGVDAKQSPSLLPTHTHIFIVYSLIIYLRILQQQRLRWEGLCVGVFVPEWFTLIVLFLC